MGDSGLATFRNDFSNVHGYLILMYLCYVCGPNDMSKELFCKEPRRNKPLDLLLEELRT